MTIDIREGEFFIDDPDSLWKGNSLHSLYQQAYTPWEWHKPIFDRARKHGMVAFSSPFDDTAVDFLSELDVPCFKIASFENTDLPLIRKVAATGKPVIISTGMATMAEIRAAVDTLRENGAGDITVLHCVSAYPAPADQSNLSAIETIRKETGAKVGWSDHTRSPAVIERAVHHWNAGTVEIHLDLDGAGAEYATGHCWLPDEIGPCIRRIREGIRADGTGYKEPVPAELPDRDWRADPSDGLRPLKSIRGSWTPA